MKPIRLTLDSGAFSAENSGKPIVLGELIDFLHEWGPLCHDYISLDVMPKTRGSLADAEAAAQASWANHVTMRKAGLNPVPVYHLGERFYWLERMIGEGFTHIGIGGLAKATRKQRREWLNSAFAFLCGDAGFPPVKVHGFGITTVPMMFRYPWYSVDSITWRKMAGYGWILAPGRQRADHGNGCADAVDYEHGWYQVCCSTGSVVRRGKQKWNGLDGDVAVVPKAVGRGSACHILERTEAGAHVRKWLRSEGFDPKELNSAAYNTLARINVRFFRRAETLHTVQPFVVSEVNQGFDRGNIHTKYGTTEPVGKFRIIYTQGDSAADSQTMTAENVRNRLLSYIYFRKKHPFDLREWIKTGLVPEKENHAAV